MFHVKLFDKKSQNFTPTSEASTGNGLQRVCKYRQMDSKILYNVSRGLGSDSFCRLGNDHFFCENSYNVIREK